MPQDMVRLRTLIGDYPVAAALKRGAVASDLVAFDFADVKVPHTAFKPFVREHKFDLGELAIITFLQAKSFGMPYVLMPATVLGRGQLHTVAYNPERGPLGPGDLAGKRVGVRSYTQTTGAWVRGMLEDIYGVDLDRVHWVTFEDPHVAEYRDPPFVERAPPGKQLAQMLLDGELDAAIIGDTFPDPRLKPLIPDAAAVERTWAESHGGIPINHMLIIREQIARTRPDVVREVYRLFLASKQAANLPTPGSLDPLRFGLAATRRSLETIISFAVRQKLIPRPVAVDDLFDETTRALG
jgi:4,5-dihydroxyphthalate decarboxylase